MVPQGFQVQSCRPLHREGTDDSLKIAPSAILLGFRAADQLYAWLHEASIILIFCALDFSPEGLLSWKREEVAASFSAMPPSRCADGIWEPSRKVPLHPSGTSVQLSRNPPPSVAGTIRASASVPIAAIHEPKSCWIGNLAKMARLCHHAGVNTNAQMDAGLRERKRLLEVF